MYLDEYYIKLVGPRLDKFRPLSRDRYECRCPICGDSRKDSNKARGYFFVYKAAWLYKCHNCGVAHNIRSFLKSVAPDLYDDYIFKKVQDDKILAPSQLPIKEEKEIKTFGEFDLPKISDLPDDHNAVSYIRARKIPTKYWQDLYYSDCFRKWTNSIVPDKFRKVDHDEERIIIPFRNKEGKILAYQGRALNSNNKIKYITIKLDPDARKIYGLDRCDLKQSFYVVEGPFDSMFLENCIAAADADLQNVPDVENAVLVWDNEPRNKQITNKMESAIKAGHKVVIWRKSNKFKDINEAVTQYHYNLADINRLVKERVFSGLSAEIEFMNWKKI